MKTTTYTIKALSTQKKGDPSCDEPPLFSFVSASPPHSGTRGMNFNLYSILILLHSRLFFPHGVLGTPRFHTGMIFDLYSIP